MADTLFWGGLYPGVPYPVLPGIEHVTYTGVPEGAIVLRRGVDVLCNDAPVGTLDHLLIEPSGGRMTHLVVEERQTGRRVIVPQAWVREIHEAAIVLSTWNPYQRGVPAYTPPRGDAELATAEWEFLYYPACSEPSSLPSAHHLYPTSTTAKTTPITKISSTLGSFRGFPTPAPDDPR